MRPLFRSAERAPVSQSRKFGVLATIAFLCFAVAIFGGCASASGAQSIWDAPRTVPCVHAARGEGAHWLMAYPEGSCVGRAEA